MKMFGERGLGTPNSSDWSQDRARFGPDGRAIRCSPLVRERLGTPGLGRPARASRDADGPQGSSCAKSVSRGLVCELWDAQVRPSRASQLRSNGFPSGSAAVGASPFSPPTPGGARRGGQRRGAKLTRYEKGKIEKTSLGTGGWASRGVRISLRSWAYSGLLGVENQWFP